MISYESTQAVIDNVAAQLARAEHFNGFSYISTPLLFPNGGSVVVRVSQAVGGAFHVTDHGLGYDEAEMISGQHYYSRIASTVAANAGINFDQHSFFTVDVTEAQLAGAIVTVANCVLESVAQVFYKVEEYKVRQTSERMYAKISRVFKSAEIAREFSFRGASTHEWVFDTMVKQDSKIILFEAVSKNHNSVFATFTKFHDVARIEDAPIRASVICSPKKYGDYLSLLSQASHVVEQQASDGIFKMLAA